MAELGLKPSVWLRAHTRRGRQGDTGEQIINPKVVWAVEGYTRVVTGPSGAFREGFLDMLLEGTFERSLS